MREAADPVHLLREQLWEPALRTGEVRALVNPSPDEDWVEVERYMMIPDARRARLLLPVAPRPVTRRLLTNYRALRPPRTSLVRAALGLGVRAGVPPGRDALSIQVRRARPDAAEMLPLSRIRHALGRPLHAATGVRDGDNRKATLHLVDERGAPVGFAKVGWNAGTDAALRAEAAALRAVDGGTSAVRVPRAVAEVDHAGHPVLVTAPLPVSARRVRPDGLTAQELYALTPVVRQDRPGRTAHLRRVTDRLDQLRQDRTVVELATLAFDLLRSVADHGSASVPVVSRWHGDLAPWNMARDETSTLWLWDWESSEPDTVAGLDALHWHASVGRLGPGAEPELPELLRRALPFLAAAGVAPGQAATVGACYAVATVERACSLAAEAGSWDGARQGPASLTRLLKHAQAGLGIGAASPGSG